MIILKNIFLIFILFFLISFVYFIYKINSHSNKDFNISNHDAIIVLTGDKMRIETGLEIWEKNKNKKLFITGVGYGINSAEFIPEKYIKNNQIILGYEAKDTIGNGKEIKKWIDEYNFKNILLITSYYHIPRTSIIISKLKNNNKVNFTFYSVKPDNFFYDLKIIVKEYIKWLITSGDIYNGKD